MRRLAAPLPQPAVYNYPAAAIYMGLPSANALRQMVHRKAAPPCFHYGKHDVRFRKVDIDAWLAAKAAANQRREEIAEAQEPPPKRRRGRPTKAEVIARRK